MIRPLPVRIIAPDPAKGTGPLMLGSTCAGSCPLPSRGIDCSAILLTDQLADRRRHLRCIIEHAVAPAFAVRRGALWAATRGSPGEAFARQVAMYLVHVGFGLSLSEVARLFARDRSTVAHACALVEDRRDAAPFDRALDLLEGLLRLLALRQL
jgi:hypothetical protein